MKGEKLYIEKFEGKFLSLCKSFLSEECKSKIIAWHILYNGTGLSKVASKHTQVTFEIKYNDVIEKSKT